MAKKLLKCRGLSGFYGCRAIACGIHELPPDRYGLFPACQRASIKIEIDMTDSKEIGRFFE
jgi:hypothetical protein